jgi:PDZ domain-containing protein
MRRQITRYTTLTLTLLGAVAVAASAQDREPENSRTRTFVYSTGPEGMQFNLRRGRMGINVDLRPNPATDSIGARVAGLTPDGAAGRAGVQVGDVITRVNGTRLAVADAADRDDNDDEQSRPAMRLLRIASRLDPGDTVRLDVRRGSQNQIFTFVAEASDMDRMVERMHMQGLPREMMGGEGPNVHLFIAGDGPSDIELVRVNAGLAEYFGTSEGLLVVDVGSDTALGLRAGDVILSIGGRRPTSPAHAMRILSTYESGETVPFEIMRQKRHANVTGRLPRRERGWSVEHNSWDMQLPDFEPMFRGMEPMFRDLEHQFHDMEPALRRQFEMRVPSPEIRLDIPRIKVRTDGWT